MASNTSHSSSLLDRLFGIDTRALATFRIGMGVLLIYDLLNRAQFLEAHYTDFGVLPRDQLTGYCWNPWFWSLHNFSGGLAWQVTLFAVALIAAVMLTLGRYTSWAAIVSWVLMISLHGRNQIVLQGGDVLWRCMLFWALWLPLGAVGSLDARRNDRTPPRRVVSFGTLALLAQLAIMYVCTGFAKNHAIWETEGTAVTYVMRLDGLTTPLGQWLGQFSTLCQWMTFTALYVERWGPLLPFIPWKNAFWRVLAVLLFWGLHLGLIATMLIGHFPYLCMLCWVLYLPSEVWDKLQAIAAGWGWRWRVPGVNDEVAPKPERRWWSYAGSVVVAMLLFMVIEWNLRILLPTNRWLKQFESFDPPLLALRLDQSWGMFAPYPLLDDGWFIIAATLADGREVNLWDPSRPIPDDKPVLREYVSSERWRKYLMNMWQIEYQPWREPFVLWAARDWNRKYGSNPDVRCTHVELHFWLERTKLEHDLPWEQLTLVKLDLDEQGEPVRKP